MNERLINLIATRQATARDLEGVAPEAVWAVKANPALVQFSCKAAGPGEVVNEEKRTIRYTWTDESVDADGDIIRLAGWDLSRYLSNPVFLWGHDGKGTPPIGKSLGITMEPGRTVPRSVVDVEYAPKDAFEFADTIFQLAKRGFVNATSAGFSVSKVSELSKEAREKLGLGPWGIEAIGQKLYEISNVSMPANENALRAELKSLVDQGVVTDKVVRDFTKTFPMTEQDFKARLKEATRTFIDMGRAQAPVLTLASVTTGTSTNGIDYTDGGVVAPLTWGFAPDTSQKDLADATTKLVDACARMVETNTRLVSAVSDLTKRIAVMGDGSGGAKASDAGLSDARRAAVAPTPAKAPASEIDIEKMGEAITAALTKALTKKD